MVVTLNIKNKVTWKGCQKQLKIFAIYQKK